MAKKIIDISNWQPKGSLDFKKLKAAGVEGVIIRAGFGRFDKQKDLSFESHYAAAKAAGLPVGAYHYNYFINEQTARDEAAVMLNWLFNKQFELPVYCDIEDKSLEKLGKTVNTRNVITYCSTLERAGYFVGVYANTNWFTNYLNRADLRRFTLWEANYNTNPNKGADMWQYTDRARINGYNGNLDANWLFREDLTELIKSMGLNGFDKPVDKPDYTEFIPGDVDGDGVVTAADARIVLQASSRLITLTPEQFKRADVLGDGQITAALARTILNMSAGLMPQLEPRRG